MPVSSKILTLAGDLPIAEVLPAVCQSLDSRHELVLEAPPGAGKTTLVPLALLDQSWLHGQKILLLEPRRLAAKTAAVRMASFLGEAVGQTVGYRMRLESRVSPHTRIEVVTEGVLTRLLQNDPALDGVGLVIFDEFHERSLDADLALALCLYARELFRESLPLKLLVMSATLDGEGVAGLLGDAPMVRSEGRTFPVATRYHPVALSGGRAGQEAFAGEVVSVILHALMAEAGSILVFLPGQREIRRVAAVLNDQLRENRALKTVRVMPLYGDLSLEQQQAAIAPAPEGSRKVVLATNIAETSLTIDGVRVVVDAGLSRQPYYDPNTALTRLHTTRVSRAASEQRQGRAGRTEPGVCYRCWPEAEQYQLAPFTPPEIEQADLTPFALQLIQWGVTPQELTWLTEPPPAAYDQACDLLARLGAVDGHSLSVHGQKMAALPVHPRLAHMMIRAAEQGEGATACQLAALLSERDLLPDAGADLAEQFEALRGERRVAHAQKNVLSRTQQLARQYESALARVCSSTNAGPSPSVGLGEMLAYAYPDRIAKKRRSGSAQYVLSNGRAAALREGDPLLKYDWLVVTNLGSTKGQKEERIYMAAALNPVAFAGNLAALVTVDDAVAWDREKQQMVAERRHRVGRLVLRSEPLVATPEQKSAALITALQKEGLTCLPWTEAARQWQSRVLFVRSQQPAENLPDVSDAALMASLADWFSPYIAGMDRFAQLAALDLDKILAAMLTWEQQQTINEWAPPDYVVPTGSRITIDYTQSPPVLAVKLQELFGLGETPAIAKGRVPLLLHLLSPARRPLQVTQDLPHFWQHSYEAVKKEMKGRYPKHPWPDDPRNADPAKGTKKQEARRAGSP